MVYGILARVSVIARLNAVNYFLIVNTFSVVAIPLPSPSPGLPFVELNTVPKSNPPMNAWSLPV
jgi:hypothetical protein